MPNYDYKCNNCNHEFETFQSMKDEKLTICPNCGENTLVRLIGTGSGLIFKGSGFYLTDYKNKPSDNAVSKSTSTETKKSEPVTASNESGNSETKTVKESSSADKTTKKETAQKSDKK